MHVENRMHGENRNNDMRRFMESIHRHDVKNQQKQHDNLALGKHEFNEFTKALMRN